MADELDIKPEDQKTQAPEHFRLEAEPEGYTTIDGSVYADAKPVQFAEPTATGEPEAVVDPDELPTDNTEGGGLPTNPREPYPTGNGPTDAGLIKGVSDG